MCECLNWRSLALVDVRDQAAGWAAGRAVVLVGQTRDTVSYAVACARRRRHAARRGRRKLAAHTQLMQPA